MKTLRQVTPHQQGLSFVGFLFVGAIIALLVVLGMRVVPSVIEYQSILKAVKYAKSQGETQAAIRSAFDKQATIDYFTAVSSKDLDISRDGNEIIVAFEYEKKIQLMGPVSLLIQYKGSSAAGK